VAHKTCVAIRHVQFEDLGTFSETLTAHGIRWTYLDAGVDDLKPAIDADLCIVLGAPIGVYDEDRYPWITDELHAISRRIENDKPTLGICFGAQAIARCAGARVYLGTRGKEIGWAPISLSDAGLDSPLAPLTKPVLHWHGDTFDLPPDAELLASTDRYRHQAFSIGDTVWGIQFHVEVAPSVIERWLIGHAIEIASAGIHPETIRSGDGNRYELSRVAGAMLTGILVRSGLVRDDEYL
jgi:GMP synthase (glutamine-hydrolysing)